MVSKAAVVEYTRDPAVEFYGAEALADCPDHGWLKTDMGGPVAEHEVSAALPGASVPALLEDAGPSGRFFSAQDCTYLD